MSVRQELTVEGMHCPSCGMLIDETLEDIPGIKRSATNVRKKRCVVEYEPGTVAVAELFAAIEGLGYKVSPANS